MSMPKTTVRSSILWQRAFIIAGWAFYAFILGAALLAAIGLTTPAAGAGPLWMIPLKTLIWPAAGHAIAVYIEYRTQKELRSSQVWFARTS